MLPPSNTKPAGPLVSIGLPVYNEEQYLRQTLDSLLCQDHLNIEIIISDNASDDMTEQICREYCQISNKIRYSRFAENMGQGANFKKVLHEARGEFFMWACGHDLWSTTFITKCLKMLQANPTAIVAVPASNWIDQHGLPLDKHSGFSDTSGMDIIARYFTLFWGNMHPAYGLMRTSIIQQWPIREIVGEDLIMLTFLAFHGDFVHASKAIWSRREFRFEKSYRARVTRYKRGPQKVAKTHFDRVFPFARLPYYLIMTALTAKSPLSVRCLIILLLIPSIFVRYLSGKAQYRT